MVGASLPAWLRSSKYRTLHTPSKVFATSCKCGILKLSMQAVAGGKLAHSTLVSFSNTFPHCTILATNRLDVCESRSDNIEVSRWVATYVLYGRKRASMCFTLNCDCWSLSILIRLARRWDKDNRLDSRRRVTALQMSTKSIVIER